MVPGSELAQSERLPQKFLEGILGDLRNGGYVAAERGRRGGYRLAKPLSQVKVGEIVRRIDGKLAPISCASETAYAPCSCPDEAHCGLRMLMIDVRNSIAGILDRYTVGDVVEITLVKLRQDGRLPAKKLALSPPGGLPTTPVPSGSTVAKRHGRRLQHADPKDGFLDQFLKSVKGPRT